MADFQVKKLTKLEEKDRISMLPETILVHILSFLSMEEAARTCVLSKHWRLRWLFCDEFDFDFNRLFKPQNLENRYHAKKLDVPVLRGRFFEWVNKVRRSHNLHVTKSSELRKLRFQFSLPLDSWYTRKIDEWVSYAFARKVQNLELDFLPYSDPKYEYYPGYEFPSRLIPGTETGSTFLRSLSLSAVQVSRADIDAFLLRFRFLEQLKVCKSYALIDVEVVGSTLALKHLEISNCGGLTSVKVRDTCLVSLTLSTVSTLKNLELENNPKLMSVRVSEPAPPPRRKDYDDYNGAYDDYY